MQYLKQFQQHLARNSYSQLLSLWEEYCMGDDIDAEELKEILNSAKASSFADSFGRYVDKALPLWERMEDSVDSHEIFKLIVDLDSSTKEEFGKVVFDYLKAKYGTDPQFELKIKLVGLRDFRKFQGAVRNFELLNHLAKGNFVFHTGGWGVGEIVDVSFLREQVALEFEYISGKKDLSFQNAFNTLMPLSKEHFLARRFGNPDSLEAYARQHHLETIEMILRDLGPKTAGEIKDELMDLVIPEEEWTKWWQTARTKIKKSTLIAAPEDAKESFKLRKTDFVHEETLEKALEKKPDADTVLQLIYSFLRDFPSSLKSDEFRKSLQTRLSELLSTHKLSDAQELQIHFLLEDLAPEKKHPAVAEFIKRLSSLQEILQTIQIVAFKKRVLSECRKHRSDWIDIFANLLLSLDSATLRDYLLTELLAAKQHDLVVRKLNELLLDPLRSPSSILWYFKKVIENEKLPLNDKEGLCRLFEAFLILLSQLDKMGISQRELVKKMLAFLSADRYANVRKVLQGSSVKEASEFLLLASKCGSLNDHDMKILHSLAEVVHPSLSKMRANAAEEEVETVIWTTEEGYNKLKNRIQEIATVETVDNAKEIEVARSHGDLRENAEFKSALERRDRLQGELKFLSTQLNQARILSKNDINTDKVQAGVIVDCKNDKGEIISYTLLGPWEANPEKNILSFQSKLAQSLKGLSVGDTFKAQDTHFTIVKIRNFFDK